MEDITFSVDGKKLNGKLFFPENSQLKNPAALFIHGWSSQQDRDFMLVKALIQRGFICMTFDLRGHGTSEGDIQRLARKDFIADVLAAYDFFTKISVTDSENIMVIGSSFGGYLATILSAQRKVRSLVLRVPSNYHDEGFEEPQQGARTTSEHKEWKSRPKDYTETIALRAVHNFRGKILLIESEKDELVSSAVIQSYGNAVINKKNLTHIVMQGASHSLSNDEPRKKEYVNIVLNWLE